MARLQNVVVGGDVGGVTGGSPVAGKQQDSPAVTRLESRTVPLAFYFLGTLDAHRDRTDKGPGVLAHTPYLSEGRLQGVTPYARKGVCESGELQTNGCSERAMLLPFRKID